MKRIFALLLCLTCQYLLAQEPYSINYSTNEGFPTSTVYSVMQDGKGFLWFSTDVGVVKYDSHKFELFNTDNGLSDNEVFRMHTDFKGRTWLLTLTGKLCFLYRGKIYNESNSNIVKKVSGSSITIDFYEDETHTIYIAYRNGEIVTIKPNDEVKKSNDNYFSIGGIWKSNDSIYIINKGVFNLTGKKSVPPFTYPSFYKAHHTPFGNYLSDNNAFYKINGNSFEKIIEIPEKIEILNSLIETPDKIWICSRSGLFLLINNKLEKVFFDDLTVTGITRDFEGGYWISTIGNGVYYIPSFNFYIDALSKEKTVKLNCISINDKKEMWVGGFENDYYIKKPNNIFEKKQLKEGKRVDKINQIRFEKNGTYVIGKVGIKKIGLDGKESILGFSANDMVIDNEKTYIGYTYTYSIPTSQIPYTINGISKPKLFIDKRTNIFALGNRCVWVGTNSGLYQLFPNGNLQFWGSKNKNLESSIEDLYYDNDSKTLFVATASKGIAIINNDKISTYTTANGLNSNTCNSIKKLSGTQYLIGSNNGLNSMEFSINKFVLKNLNALLSLKNSRINDIDYLNHKVYLATADGLLYFNLNKLYAKKARPKCDIIRMTVNNRIISNSAVLSHNQKEISIDFIGISYLNQGNLTYFYRLNKNDYWTKSNETKINYRSLPAGKYTFSVFCKNGFGSKSEIKRISFEILPAFWEKTWFICLMLLLAGLGVYVFIRYRLNLQKRKFEIEKKNIQTERDKAQLEKQMVELEQKALRLQMNPHFIFNALNTIKGYYSEGDNINASSYISKFSKLLRMLLENTEQLIPLAKEIEMLDIYINLTKIRYKDKFEYQLVVDERLNINEIAIPTLLLQPIVENAIIHGLAPKDDKGELIISFLLKENQLECCVDDNGIGRKASQKKNETKEYTSKALEITRERLLLLNSDGSEASIKILDLEKDGSASGTKVIITIPLISIW